jgi:type IV secretory pathway VirB3-like protein
MFLMNTPVLTAVAGPLTIVGASWKATMGNIGLSVFAILFLGASVKIFCAFALVQMLAIALTYKDPNFMEVLEVWLRCKSTPMFLLEKGHRYVG